ncbi:MAG: Type II secretion system protein E [Stenotrophomonas maltophilia]|uniref:Type II secretion system protein E n=1 Tax=Stenotrophomonas maltophilia TaxID=40324 RepID=A0A7V8FF98_STEMA|nr:MAG: Type II secretion system protein E [Stenotrophomonas maltophilia]
MNAVTTANLVGITGIARRLVQDGALDEATARDAMAKATAARQPLPQWFAQNKLVTASQLAAANSVEFGMPLFDVSTFDASQNAMSLVSEELLRKHNVLPLFKRGGKLFVGTSNPTHALDEIKFHTNLVVEPILIDEDQIRRTLEQWHASHDTMGDALGGDDEGMANLDVGSGDEEGGSDTGIDAKGDDTPVVKFVNKVLVDAIRKGASDIHFEPYEDDYRVRR